jgi:hypothetical protein
MSFAATLTLYRGSDDECFGHFHSYEEELGNGLHHISSLI